MPTCYDVRGTDLLPLHISLHHTFPTSGTLSVLLLPDISSINKYFIEVNEHKYLEKHVVDDDEKIYFIRFFTKYHQNIYVLSS